MQVLRLEASFNIADVKPANMIVAVESILSQTRATDETKNLNRHQVSSLLMAHRLRDVLSKVESDALKELRADNDLVIVPADTGRSTVVLDRTDYNQKVKILLEDRPGSRGHRTTPTREIRRKGKSPPTRANHSAFEVLSQDILYVRRKNLRAGEGNANGFANFGIHSQKAVLQRLEMLVFRQHRPKFWAWYVEDTFVVIERDQILTFKEHLNAVFPDIQFTMEEEEEEKEEEEEQQQQQEEEEEEEEKEEEEEEEEEEEKKTNFSEYSHATIEKSNWRTRFFSNSSSGQNGYNEV
nr:unnamed protein product [Spirometra erinaceieuropaei]